MKKKLISESSPFLITMLSLENPGWRNGIPKSTGKHIKSPSHRNKIYYQFRNSNHMPSPPNARHHWLQDTTSPPSNQSICNQENNNSLIQASLSPSQKDIMVNSTSEAA